MLIWPFCFHSYGRLIFASVIKQPAQLRILGAEENFMYDEKGSNHLKLIDFGFSKAWDPEKNKKLKMNCALLAPVSSKWARYPNFMGIEMVKMGVSAVASWGTSDETISILDQLILDKSN